MGRLGGFSVIKGSDISNKDHRESNIPETEGNILVHIEDVVTGTFSISKGTSGIGFFLESMFSIDPISNSLPKEKIAQNKKEFINKLLSFRKKGFNIYVVDAALMRLSQYGIDLDYETRPRNLKIVLWIILLTIVGLIFGGPFGAFICFSIGLGVFRETRYSLLRGIHVIANPGARR